MAARAALYHRVSTVDQNPQLDRFGRSAFDLLGNIRQLDVSGVRFVSVTQGIDIRPGGDPMSRLLITKLSAIAEFERDLIVERTRLGDRGRCKLVRAPGGSLPTATVGHLIAMKLLSEAPHRPDDASDLIAMLANASRTDLATARAAIRLIRARGHASRRDLNASLEKFRKLARASSSDLRAIARPRAPRRKS